MSAKENLSAVYRNVDSKLGGNLSRIGLAAAVVANLGAVGCGTPSSSTIETNPTNTATEPALATQTSIPLVIKPTETPVPPTATPTEVPKKPENILPEYSVYYGSMQEEKSNGKGSVIFANIPGYPNQLYGFFITNRSGQGLLYNISKVETDSKTITLKDHGGVTLTLKDTNTLSGRLESLYPARPTSWTFDIAYYGKGRDAAIEAVQKLWAKEVANDPTLWQKVPQETALGVGFRKIELP